MTIPAGSTTNTSDYQSAVAFVVRQTTLAAKITIIGSLTMKHSVSAGQFDLLISMYHDRAGSAGGYNLLDQRDITLHQTADRYELVPLVQEFINNQPAYPYGLFVPGEHLVALWLKNRTAGTLTWAPSGQNHTLAWSEIGSVYASV